MILPAGRGGSECGTFGLWNRQRWTAPRPRNRPGDGRTRAWFSIPGASRRRRVGRGLPRRHRSKRRS